MKHTQPKDAQSTDTQTSVQPANIPQNDKNRIQLSAEMANRLIKIASKMEIRDKYMLYPLINHGLKVYGKEKMLMELGDHIKSNAKHSKYTQYVDSHAPERLYDLDKDELIFLLIELKGLEFLEKAVNAFLSSKDNRKYIMKLIAYSAINGDLQLVTYFTNLRDQKGERFFSNYKKSTINSATSSGNLEIVEYLINLTNDKGERFIKLQNEEKDEEEDEVEVDQDKQCMQYIIDEFIYAVKQGQSHIARYLATLKDTQGKLALEYMCEDQEPFWGCYNNYELSTLSMTNALFQELDPTAPPFLETAQQSTGHRKTILVALERYQEREKELVVKAGLDTAHQVYSVISLYNTIKSRKQEVLELYCCLQNIDMELPVELQKLIVSAYLISSQYFLIPHHNLYMIKISQSFLMPTEKEIEDVKIEGVEEMSQASKRHLAILSKAVEASSAQAQPAKQ